MNICLYKYTHTQKAMQATAALASPVWSYLHSCSFEVMVSVPWLFCSAWSSANALRSAAEG